MSAPREDDEFFVGYFPTPPRTKRFVIGATVLGLAVLLGLGAAFSSLRTAPARASYEAGVELVGLLDVDHHGLLWVPDDDAPSGATAHILTKGGKFGFPASARRHDDDIVRIRGGLLDRGGYRMLEMGGIEAAPGALDADDEALLRRIPHESQGEVTVRGVIEDSKCFLGRMRPGQGRTHRGCAQFCIAGGIPPLLIERRPGGGYRHYLLTSGEGAAVNDEILPFVAEPVELTGRLERRGDLLFLGIDPARIRRL
jgi:hypothetical protein